MNKYIIIIQCDNSEVDVSPPPCRIEEGVTYCCVGLGNALPLKGRVCSPGAVEKLY